MSDWNELVDPSRRYESPCKNARRASITKPTHIVIHITGTDKFAPCYNRFMTPGQASAHYLVDREGQIHQFVRDADRAWHAGIEAAGSALYKKNDGSWRKYKTFFDWSSYPPDSKYHDASLGPVDKARAKLVSRGDGSEWPDYEYFDKRWGRLHQPFYFDKDQDPNSYSIGIEMLSVGGTTSGPYPEALYEGMERLLANLCAKHGIPRDREHIIGHEDVHPIARWGWDPNQGFDWARMLRESASPVTFPLDGKSGGPGPVRYLFLNETRKDGGYYPLGLHQNIHSGAHLTQEGASEPYSPVRSLAPGYLVAARLTGALPPAIASGDTGGGTSKSALTQEMALAGNSFVLVRHVLEEIIPADSKAEPKRFTFYTLSMHLSPPDWDSETSAKLHGQVPWIDALARRRNGSVIVVDPGLATFGQRWLPAREVNDKTRGGGKLATFGATFADTVEVTLGPDEPGRTIAVCRTADAKVKEALAALAGGKVVTFARPSVVLGRGERIGYIKSSGFLHWEVLAPAGAAGGLEELLDFACEKLGLPADLFARYQEKTENNLFDPEDDEIADLLALLPDDDADKLLALSETYTPEQLVRVWSTGHRLVFATGKPQGAAAPQGELCYPLRIELESFRDAMPAGKYSLTVRFEPDTFPPRTVELDPSAGHADVMVPAGATKIVLESTNYFIELDNKPPTLAQDAAHLGRLAAARLRNVVLEHLNEWSKDGLLAAMKPRFADEPDKDLDPYASATAFWANEEKAVASADGKEKKLFAAAPDAEQLPEKTKLAQAHPVITGWIAGLLVKHGIARFREQFAPQGADDAAQQLFYLGWMPDDSPVRPRTVGDPLFAVAVAAGDVHGTEEIVLQASGPGGGAPVPIAKGKYDKGLLRASLPCPFWGDWKLEAASLSPEIGHTALSGLEPELGDLAAPVKDKKGLYSWSIHIMKNRPSRIRGLVLIEHWTTEAGKAPSGPGTLAKLGIPIEAAPPQPQATKLRYDPTGQWITGAVDKSKIWVTPSFALSEYTAVFAGDASQFRLAVALAERLEKVRTAYATLLQNPKAGVSVVALSADGLSATVACHSFTAANHKSLASAAKQDPALFSAILEGDKNIGLTVPAPPPGKAGPVNTTFDPAAAFGQLLAAASLGPGDVMLLRFGVFFPNGGSLVLPSWPEPGGATSIEIDPDKLRAECKGALCGFTAAPVATLRKPQIGAITATVQGDSLVLTAPLHGAAADWAAAKPMFVWKSKAGKEEKTGSKAASSNNLIATIKLSDPKLQGAKIKFEAQATDKGALFDGQKIAVAKSSIEIDTAPRIESLEIVWTASHLVVQGVAGSFPTDHYLELVVLSGEKDTGLGATAVFQSRNDAKGAPRNWGYADPAGVVVARIERKLVAQKLAEGDRFKVTLGRPKARDQVVLGTKVEPGSAEGTVPGAEAAN